MKFNEKQATANLENLERIFTVPEDPSSTLGLIDNEISQNLVGFLTENIVACQQEIEDIETDFSDPVIPQDPKFVSAQTHFLLDKLVSKSVHTSSPSFVGHMTSALPTFMLPLSRIMIALNQNMVKVETSKAFTPMERQTIGMIHHLIYGREDEFYTRWMHDHHNCIGSFCSGGTIANITALWAARNHFLAPDGDFAGIGQDGLVAALQHYGYKGIAVLASERAHYSLAKSADILGIGRANIVTVETDRKQRVKTAELARRAKELKARGIMPFSVIGIAGTSETGSVDPLNELAEIAGDIGAMFHVDAAWGGPTLFSDKYRDILSGIEHADSVTIDAHKQLYVPMGAGMVVFKEPNLASSIEHHAEYVVRKGSKDIGSFSLEGSRSGMAMLVHSSLNIIGHKGYGILIDQGIEKARRFAELIKAQPDFALVSEPELNILTYRLVPEDLQQTLLDASEHEANQINEILNKLTKHIQKIQRARGKSFVSRTQLKPIEQHRYPVVVFRVVLANPLSTDEVLADILEEQRAIFAESSSQAIIAELDNIEPLTDVG
ncbi:Aspartate 1-decarboxylase [BD1-7 clade bacterium]|uniref:Aspartate 1-decarboxylase n=1 Tax=BD1-7 clade bacterium TaxID=2029982 RepID=A0A5S9NKM1_9GAMM|nr:Aspartate 1-decarboxylase [BD1-7 clade bacterium]CAA0093061.1 Aspartate 1-decarboxylase [BD1-7 clade bacterium]